MTSHSHQQLLVRLDGVFDLPAAQRLARTVLEAPEGELSIDLTHVREFHDHGVVVLAQALVGRRPVRLRGLRQHQVRLLRYLGIETEEPQPTADAEYP